MEDSNLSNVLLGLLWSLFQKALSPKVRLHWIYLLSALVLAIGVYWISRKRGEPRTLAQFLFPRTVWLHHSAVVDYLFVSITLPLWALLVAPQLLSATRVSNALLASAKCCLEGAAPTAIPSMAIAALYTVVLVVVADLKLYWVHRLMHRVPALWEFHKVHHSAEVLTPITFYRSHPVDMLAQSIAEACGTGLVTAVFAYLFPQSLAPLTVLGVNAIRFAFYICGANLRHSHVRLSFGSVAEHLIISPAQHQIHHSSDPKHLNRNFGSELAVWDWLFGTLYIPKGREEITFGLGESESRRLSSVRQLLVNPFLALGRRFVFGAALPQSKAIQEE